VTEIGGYDDPSNNLQGKPASRGGGGGGRGGWGGGGGGAGGGAAIGGDGELHGQAQDPEGEKARPSNPKQQRRAPYSCHDRHAETLRGPSRSG